MIVSIINQKGGVGKTTTAVTLAHGLAMRGYRTLLIDLDPQGNTGDCLGLEAGNDLFPLLTPGAKIPLEKGVVQARERLDVIRSDKGTSVLKVMVSAMEMREFVLDNLLKGHGYDVILLDVAPSVDVLMHAAIVASHYLLIPTRLDQLSIKGIRELVDSLESLKRITTCEVGAILPCFYDRTTKESYKQMKTLVGAFRQLVWPPIPQDTACRVSSRLGKTLWEYAPKTRAIVGYPDKTTTIGGYKQALDLLEKNLIRRK